MRHLINSFVTFFNNPETINALEYIVKISVGVVNI
jgi:hypothetical protein